MRNIAKVTSFISFKELGPSCDLILHLSGYFCSTQNKQGRKYQYSERRDEQVKSFVSNEHILELVDIPGHTKPVNFGHMTSRSQETYPLCLKQSRLVVMIVLNYRKPGADKILSSLVFKHYGHLTLRLRNSTNFQPTFTNELSKSTGDTLLIYLTSKPSCSFPNLLKFLGHHVNDKYFRCSQRT